MGAADNNDGENCLRWGIQALLFYTLCTEGQSVSKCRSVLTCTG